jgi:hypothetical protein
MKIDLTWEQLDITVDCRYEPKDDETLDTPGSRAWCDVYEVWVGGVDIQHILSSAQLREIEQIILKSYEE